MTKKYLLLLIAFLVITSCGKQKSLDDMNDIELFNHAEILYKDKSYEDAIEAYEKLKNNYPKRCRREC